MLSPIGLVAVDLIGEVVGRVEATHPYADDAPEFAVVRLARGPIGESRLVPLTGSVRFSECVQFAHTLSEVERAPAPEEADWGVGPVELARAYW